MSKGRRTRKSASEPIAATLDEIAERHDLKPASELPAPPSPEPVSETPQRDHPSAEPAIAEIQAPAAPDPIRRNHAPAGFINRARHEAAGLRVNQGHGPMEATSGVAFDEDRLPERHEKDAMEMRGVRYHEGRRQWERTDKERPLANYFEMEQLGRELAAGRPQGVAR